MLVTRAVGETLAELKVVIKDVVMKELEEVTNEWKKLVSEKDRISELMKELEKKRNGRVSEQA